MRDYLPMVFNAGARAGAYMQCEMFLVVHACRLVGRAEYSKEKTRRERR
jgi:hypothetical protein